MSLHHPSGRSYFQRSSDTPLLESTIPAHLAAIAATHGNRLALIALPQNRRLTYRQFTDETDRLARGLLGLGFQPGDRIGIWSTNNLEWVLLQFATARIGAILVNINPAYRPRELAYALEQSELNGLFLIPRGRNSDYIAMLDELIPGLGSAKQPITRCERFPHLRSLVLFDPHEPTATERERNGFLLWREALAAGNTVTPRQLDTVTATLDPNDPINIQYTSGTTGFPKAVLLTHRNILNNAWFAARAMHFEADDRLCVPVPFYHCFGMVLANLMAISVGGSLVIPSEQFDPHRTLAALQNERCTAVHGVPTMFIAMLEETDFADFDLSALRTGIMAGAPCPAPLMKRVMREMHCPEILIGYGQTEASPLTHLTSREDSLERRTETVGRNLPHQEVKVVDPRSGETVALGCDGEICFRGYHVMRGYFGNTDATAETIDDDGWLHSGDLGSMDSDGYLRITGRLKEMIIRGGENIYPAEIEAVFYTHPKVAECAVFGVADNYYGETVAAWVQFHPGQSATREELQDFCRERLAPFKVPQHFWFVNGFPMTVTGKLQKFRMREWSEKALQSGTDIPHEALS